MLAVRRADERGSANLGWLNSRHSFSFGRYFDPEFMGFGSLRVINEDRVRPGRGFDTHGHQDMEIISYVLSGALRHRDSMGNGSVIRPGDVQRMSAGTGVRHSEYNASNEEDVHFLQIWIVPDREGLEPSYEQIHVATDDKRGIAKLIGSRDGREGSVTIHQDTDLYAACLDAGESLTHRVAAGRQAWVQVARGRAQINEANVVAGDGIAVPGDTTLVLRGADDAELLVFDMN